MNPLERVKATLQCERTDRIPVIPEVAAVTAKLRGKSVREYVSNGEVLAECQLAAQETFQYDVVIAFADLCVEAEAIGWDCYYHEGIRHYLQRAWQGGFNRRIRHECQRGHAIRIGLIPEVPVEKAVFISNAAGVGARLYLLYKDAVRDVEEIAGKIRHINVANDAAFNNIFIDAMLF